MRHAGKVLDGVAAASQELAGLRDRLAGRLVVGGFPTATAALLPRAVARLLTDHPGLQVQLMEAPTPAQLRTLRRGRLEVAILARGEGLPAYDLDGLHVSELRTGRGAGVAVPDSHPFAVRDWVEPEELADQAWVVGASHGESPEFGAWPGTAEPEVSFAVRDWPTHLGLVSAGLGIALVPGFAAQPCRTASAGSPSATRALDCAARSVRSQPTTPAPPPGRWSAPWRTRSRRASRTAVRAWLIKQMRRSRHESALVTRTEQSIWTSSSVDAPTGPREIDRGFAAPGGVPVRRWPC